MLRYIRERKPVVDQALEGTQAATLCGPLEGWLIRTQGLECQSTGRSGFQGIGHMQIVRPGFGPVLPGMRTRIGADEPLRPVCRRTPLVIPRQSRAIICTLVPEEVAKSVEPVTGLEQPFPIIINEPVKG